MEESSEKKAWTFPPKSIDFWYQTSVALALISAGAILPVMFYIFSAAGNSDLVDERVKLTTALGTSLGVLLTFSTVVWRGLVGEFQAREQKRANDAKDEENRTILFHKGLELLSQDETHGTNVAAGITTLELVASVKDSRFSQPATDALADYIIKHVKTANRSQSVRMANMALKRGIALGIRSTRSLTVECSDEHELHIAFYGFSSVEYIDGKFQFDPTTGENSTEDYAFSGVTFSRVKFEKYSHSFVECTFYKCTFVEIEVYDMLYNKFEYCDFSSAELLNGIEGLETTAALGANLGEHLQGCYYRKGQRPSGIEEAIVCEMLTELDWPNQRQITNGNSATLANV